VKGDTTRQHEGNEPENHLKGPKDPNENCGPGEEGRRQDIRLLRETENKGPVDLPQGGREEVREEWGGCNLQKISSTTKHTEKRKEKIFRDRGKPSSMKRKHSTGRRKRDIWSP